MGVKGGWPTLYASLELLVAHLLVSLEPLGGLADLPSCSIRNFHGTHTLLMLFSQSTWSLSDYRL